MGSPIAARPSPSSRSESGSSSFRTRAQLVAGHGHELGNHTWSHPDLARLGRAALRTEIERCWDRLAALIRGPGAFLGPSAVRHATEQVRRLAGAAGYAKVLSYDVDSRDSPIPMPHQSAAMCVRRPPEVW